jgi:hypothetical protein
MGSLELFFNILLSCASSFIFALSAEDIKVAATSISNPVVSQ